MLLSKLQVTDQIDQGHKARESDQGNSSDEAFGGSMVTFPVQAKCYIVASKETQQLGKPRPGVYIEISPQKLKVI